MEVIRTISQVTDNTLILYGLDALNGKTVEIVIRPISKEKRPLEDDPISSARGCLKGLGFTSKQYFQAKHAEKELEK